MKFVMSGEKVQGRRKIQKKKKKKIPVANWRAKRTRFMENVEARPQNNREDDALPPFQNLTVPTFRHDPTTVPRMTRISKTQNRNDGEGVALLFVFSYSVLDQIHFVLLFNRQGKIRLKQKKKKERRSSSLQVVAVAGCDKPEGQSSYCARHPCDCD
jgi:hypothetical protein